MALSTILDSIRKRLTKLPEGEKTGLNLSAGADANERFAKDLEFAELPSDLSAWFACHNGQDMFAKGIDPDEPAMKWLSITESLDAWRFLRDPKEDVLQPWSPRWIPIAQNGGGDYYVYVASGESEGKVLFYLHDDTSRSVVAASLEAFAKAIEKRIASLEKALESKATLPARVSDEGATWSHVDAPTAEALADAPLGTAFLRRSLPYQGYGYRIYVKLGKRQWIMGKARHEKRDDDYSTVGALADIAQRLAEETPSDWNVKEADIVTALADEQVYPAELIALGGKPSRGNPYFVRLGATLGLV